MWMLAKIQALYRVEKLARGLNPVERLAIRRVQALPLLAEIDDWRKKQSALPKSPMGQALTYLDNQWDALNVYATARHLEIDNNPAERALRPIAVGRKNWLLVGPARAAAKRPQCSTRSLRVAANCTSIRSPIFPTCSPASWTTPDPYRRIAPDPLDQGAS